MTASKDKLDFIYGESVQNGYKFEALVMLRQDGTRYIVTRITDTRTEQIVKEETPEWARSFVTLADVLGCKATEVWLECRAEELKATLPSA